MTQSSLGKDAIDALTQLAGAQSAMDSLHALLRAREALGPHADRWESFLVTLAQRSEEIDRLRQMVGSDPLTGVANRRAFDQALAREAARHNRTGEPFAVIMLDLDAFKQRNDHFGHAAGDAALIAVSRACESVVRITDLVARLGGDEFSVLLPGSTQAGAHTLAARLRAAIESAGLPEGALRVSVGVAASEGKTVMASDVLRLADQDLYRDKSERRKARSRAA